LAKHVGVVCRVESPADVAASIRGTFSVRETVGPRLGDLDLFHVGNSPAQGYVWKTARQRPGVVVLHEWCLTHVVRHETLGKGDGRGWRREARLGRGAQGAFFAELVEAGWGGDILPLCFPSNEALLHGALGVVTLSRATADRVRGLHPRAPVLALPQHFVPPAVTPERGGARVGLGIADGRFVIVSPGLATPAKRLDLAVSALARLVAAGVDAELIVVGPPPPSGSSVIRLAHDAGVADRVRETGRLSPSSFAAALVAADVVLGLRFPSHGETSAAAIRALGLGACVFLTAGSETAMEIPRATCVLVAPGPSEGTELTELLLTIARRPDWRMALGAAAREHIARHHSLGGTVSTLVTFLEEVRESQKGRRSRSMKRSLGLPPPRSSVSEGRAALAAQLLEEACLAGLEIGIDPDLLPLDDLVNSLLGGPA
jgi:glycosyltransferase involved in cell wall biosynthesis